MTRVSNAEAVQSLLAPESVAIVGASSRLEAMSGASLANLRRHGYAGRVVPINPRHETLMDLPCVPTLDALVEPVDTLVVVTPAAAVPDVLRSAKGRARSATIVTAGFASLGLQDELAEAVAASGLRILGPNTAGLINVASSYCPRAAQNHVADLRSGPIALVSQSGGLGNVIFNRAQAAGVGISFTVATGDGLDLDVWDFVDYALDDEHIDTVMLAVESGLDPVRLVAGAARALERRKPLVLLALGEGEVARQAAATHTGAVAGSHQVELAAARELGVTVVGDIDALWQSAAVLSRWDITATPSGMRRLGVLTISGGLGVAAADEAERKGFTLPAPAAEIQGRLNAMLSLGAAGNPMDPTGEVLTKPDLLRDVVREFTSDAGYDGVLVALPTLQAVSARQVIPPITSAVGETHGRVLVSTYLAGAESDLARRLLEEGGMPFVDGLPQAVAALTSVYDRSAIGVDEAQVRIGSARRWCLAPRKAGSALSYIESRAVLERWNVPLAPARIVDDAYMAARAFDELGPIVVLKASSATVPHKFKAGLVLLGITSRGEAMRAWEVLEARAAALADCDGIICESAAQEGLDLLLGGVADPRFGPVVGVGTGAWYAESAGDTSLLPAPLSEGAARRALGNSLPGRFLLKEKPEVFRTLAELVAIVSERYAESDAVAEFDVNPVRIDATGRISALDALVVAAQ